MPVYIVCEDIHIGPTKIGFCNGEGENRLSNLQVGNPRKLQLAYSFELPKWEHERDLECLLHKRLEALKLRGEWFSVGASAAKLATIALCEANGWALYSRPEGTIEPPFGENPRPINRAAQRRLVDSL